MSRLPVISGEKAIKCFEKLDYVVVRQKGSHIRMRHKSDKSRKPLTIPKHKVLGKGLLRLSHNNHSHNGKKNTPLTNKTKDPKYDELLKKYK